MRADIKTRADIDRLMHVFYERAMTDPVIGYIFTDIAHLDLDHHLPIIGDFWESLLFGTQSYAKHGRNPLQVHKELHAKSELSEQHFERWLEIFTATVDDLFEGELADHLKIRARAIAGRMLEFLGIADRGSITPAGIHSENRPHPR
jgi:hemoglobin